MHLTAGHLYLNYLFFLETVHFQNQRCCIAGCDDSAGGPSLQAELVYTAWGAEDSGGAVHWLVLK